METTYETFPKAKRRDPAQSRRDTQALPIYATHSTTTKQDAQTAVDVIFQAAELRIVVQGYEGTRSARVSDLYADAGRFSWWGANHDENGCRGSDWPIPSEVSSTALA